MFSLIVFLTLCRVNQAPASSSFCFKRFIYRQPHIHTCLALPSLLSSLLQHCSRTRHLYLCMMGQGNTWNLRLKYTLYLFILEAFFKSTFLVNPILSHIHCIFRSRSMRCFKCGSSMGVHISQALFHCIVSCTLHDDPRQRRTFKLYNCTDMCPCVRVRKVLVIYS